jgi:hypothetical protein
MDARELGEWMAFYKIEPFGFDADNHRAGVIAQLVGEIHRNRKKQPKPFTIDDFYPMSCSNESKKMGENKDDKADRMKQIFRFFQGFWEAKKKQNG